MNARILPAAVAAAALGLCLGCSRDPATAPAVGTLERERIELTAEVSEPIVEIAVREGDMVEPGALLVQLDPARLSAQVAGAQASRDQVAARLAELERGPRGERIREARASLTVADSAARVAELDWQRMRELEQGAVASASQLDNARARRDSAVAQREQARAVLDELEQGSTSEELQQARSALAASEAALAESRIRRERLSIRAPQAGRVDALPFELGERPAVGASVAVLLAEGTPYARVYVPEAVRVHIGHGSRARIQIAGREGELVGTVRSIAHDAAFTPYFALTQHDRGHLVYLAEVDVQDAGAGELPSGVPVEVHFELGSASASTQGERP